MASTISHRPEKTFAVARAFADELRANDVIALVGELGAGKTHFVKGLAAGLGYRGEITSPTFTLIHEYPGGRLPLYHFDFYRLETIGETERLDIDHYFTSEGICVIEWAGKFPELLPAHTRWVELRIRPDEKREIVEREGTG